MKAYKIFTMLFLALAINACQDDETLSAPSMLGDYVQFGTMLQDNDLSRTIYGPKNGNAYPVYWLKGDQVKISAPDCLTGRNTGTYQVLDAADGTAKSDALNMVGEVGVQWGEKSSDFYSIYPASGVNAISGDGKTYTLTMPINQMLKKVDGSNILSPDMDGCFMYAEASNVANGSTVNLIYTPFSTALRFTVQGFANKNDTPDNASVVINNVRLIAPANTFISGEFTYNFETDKVAVTASKAYNYVDLGGQQGENAVLSIGKNQSYEFTAFLIPGQDYTLTADWKIQVSLNDGKTYTKSLLDHKLQTSKINRLTTPLPNVAYTDSTNWSAASWMTNIPRNVYLSEMSLPGSWNSLNSEFQGSSNTIATQYAAGVRAFHLDCRYSGNVKSGLFSGSVSAPYYLAVADGNAATYSTIIGQSNIKGSDDGTFSSASSPKVANALCQIKDCILSNPGEYVVVFCSFAQGASKDPFNENGTNPIRWITDINDACNALGDIVYDASKLTENTTLDEVLGKMIVVINCEDSIGTADGQFNPSSIPANSKMLYTYIASELEKDTHFPATGFVNNDIYSSSSSSSSSSVKFASSQAQVSSSKTEGISSTNRGYFPLLSERDAMVNRILDWSKENYKKDNYAHNQWVYLGLGGYTSDDANGGTDSGSHTTIANHFYSMINTRITNMASNWYYPLGIVFQNQTVSNTNVKSTVKNIYELNHKYQLQFDATKPAWPATPAAAEVKSAAPGYSSGMTDNNTNAFSWE